MTDILTSPWFFWSIGIALGLPLGLIALTEWQQSLRRTHSVLVRPVTVLRNYLLPVGALLLLLIEAKQIPPEATSVRLVGTLFAFVVLVLVLSGVSAALFQGAPEGTWRKRVPVIFVDVARFVVIVVGVGMIFSYIWGANVRGLFTALGVTSIVMGLALQQSVGQIVSGLLMLFEQPFRIGDWLDTPTAHGHVVEVNWRAVHLQTDNGLQITPNSVLATSSFTNVSRPVGKHKIAIISVFSLDDPPDRVCAMLLRVAAGLPQLRVDTPPLSIPLGGAEYRTTIPLHSFGDDGEAKATFLRWIWYAARREGLHLDHATEDFSTPERVADAIRTVVAPTLRIGLEDQQTLIAHSTLQRYGADEKVQGSGEVPHHMLFIVAGRVLLTAATVDGPEIAVDTLDEGSFLGQSTLTRQPVIGCAYAVGEVTVVQIEREQVETLVHRNPLLMQEFGRTIEERRANVRRAITTDELAQSRSD
ncbi:mechanosensitive ion channel family protein [Mycobacteroides salmoniphilum]|uniref:mechanosensitive ion channel family protein n=1 Tax=Mycobacteroides salmoniphilum TaxID=404941 RepID=UPI00099209CB|nr:mechanosensitive ion channel family protein [Mycobacteroides salmoniphilum]